MEHLGGRNVRVVRARTVIIGSGCAGLNAVDCLHALGERDVLLMTEGMQAGTSRNTGSDKQTYYKLSLSGDEPDSVQRMAEALCAKGTHGDLALAMAACSAQSFFKLVQLGVPFPTNEYGEFVGYQTDHDATRRATSAGPLTSKLMTEALERSVVARGISVMDQTMAFELLVRNGKIVGVLALDMKEHALVLVLCAHVILATGGPAQIYRDSVYPESQSGMSSLALLAGAKAENLDQWQYGLASIGFRWNVSGSYQQVLPRFVSVDEFGTEREFLIEAFESPMKAIGACFLKGYQWPFDAAKAEGGSSRVDLLVHRQRQLGRRVYLDYTRNPKGLDEKFTGLDAEAMSYLRKCGALQKTPIERLCAMNAPAIELYLSHGIDLSKEYLEIAVCAQHCNGGIAVDANWQTSVVGLYAVGEVAATFGVQRPGGSALNAAQVGALRAAEHIAHQSLRGVPELNGLGERLNEVLCGLDLEADAEEIRVDMQRLMSAECAHERSERALDDYLKIARARLAGRLEALPDVLPEDIAARLKLRDQLVCSLAVADAMRLSAQKLGSYGAAMVKGEDGRIIGALRPGDNLLVETQFHADDISCHSRLIPPRPMPLGDQWFETAWKAYRARTERKPAQTG